MRIAITGGTGFVGRHLARRISMNGHSVVLIARGEDRRDEAIRGLSGARLLFTSVDDVDRLTEAFRGCDAVAHCAGINRQIGRQTYQRVHVEGTAAVVRAARTAGVRKILMLSFLRARPDCGSAYHESKWQAEEIVRSSSMDYTILKAGVIYGRGDHMLDHLSRAFYTFPLFALVGFHDRPVRPVAVQDVARILETALTDARLSRKTVPVLGPEQMTLPEAVRRVAEAVGRIPMFFRAPVFLHYAMAWVFERLMVIPLVSLAQVRILSEGVTEIPFALDQLPGDLMPQTRFERSQIQEGLPAAGGFQLTDLRCLARAAG